MLQIIVSSLNAGYIDPENGEHIIPSEGTPQGSVLGHCFANIVLHELDLYLEQFRKDFEKGKARRPNPEYSALTSKIQRLSKKSPKPVAEIRTLLDQRRKLPTCIYKDPDYKRLRYLRYASRSADFVVLISGNLDDAKLIKARIKSILAKKCGLSLNDEKTVISLTKDGFKFLGAFCKNVSANEIQFFVKNKWGKISLCPSGKRMRMRILAPIKELIAKLVKNKFAKLNEKGMPVSTARKDLVNFSHYEILTFYNHRIRGLLNFYSFAGNRNDLRKIILFLQQSCALTLALKLKLRTKGQIFKKFGFNLSPQNSRYAQILGSTTSLRSSKSEYRITRRRSSRLMIR